MKTAGFIERGTQQYKNRLAELAVEIIGTIAYGQIHGSTRGVDDIAERILWRENVMASRAEMIAELTAELEWFRSRYPDDKYERPRLTVDDPNG